MGEITLQPGIRPSFIIEVNESLTNLNMTLEINKKNLIQTKAQHNATESLTVETEKKSATAANRVSDGRPTLALPVKVNDSKYSNFTTLIAQFKALLSNNEIDKLTNNLQHLNALTQAKTASNALKAKEHANALQDSDKAFDTAKDDTSALALAKDTYEQSKVSQSNAEQRLASLSPEDPQYQEAKNELDNATFAKFVANAALGLCSEKAQTSANLAMVALKLADQLLGKLLDSSGVDPVLISATYKQHLTGLAAMTLLMGELSKLLGDNADSKIQANAELSKQLHESRQKEMRIKAEEQAEAIRKAEHLNKVMGCVGKILGGLLTAVSIVGAVFTGGASLALAAVGIALMVADPIVKAITGESITDRVMAPIMEHVIQPMIKFFADAIQSFMKGTGLDKKLGENVSEIIATIVATIVTVVTIIVASLLAKSAGSAMLKKIMPALEKAIAAFIKNTVPNVVKNSGRLVSGAAKTSIKRLGKNLGLAQNPASMARLKLTARVAELGTAAAKTSVDSAHNIISGIATKDIAEDEAEITIAMADTKAISKYLKLAVEIFTAESKASMDLVNEISTLNISRQQTNMSILNALRA
ncbi:hypothetical protein ASE93_01240 [Serratia sp. Leaf50]|nr:hypothetical protein ASE93_01240 [Serratia sp. Leaf50]